MPAMAGLRLRAGRSLATAVLCVLSVAWLGAPPAHAALPAQFSLTGGGKVIPRAFFGLSVEDDQLATYERMGPVFAAVLALIRPQDDPYMVLRIGGKSADHTVWEPHGFPRPTGVAPLRSTSSPYRMLPYHPRGLIVVGHQWVSSLGALVRADGLQVLLDLNLAVHSTAMEDGFVRAVQRAIPPHRLVGLAIGNEPDLYWRQPQLVRESEMVHSAARPNWNVGYSWNEYRRDYTAYATSLAKEFPKARIGGPETISAPVPWLDTVEDLGPLSASFLTVHRYASSNCWPSWSRYYPTIPLLLAPNASVGLAHTVAGAATVAHSHHQQLRLTEVNSISCGGNGGVANSFATALWTPDALLAMADVGVDAVNWHIRPGTLNAPFHPEANGTIQVEPELYGLAMFAELTRPGAEILNSSLIQFGGLQLAAWAVRYQGGVRVLLLNKGSLAAAVSLTLPASRPGLVRRLLAPSIGSESGITYGGQTIGPDGLWHGQVALTKVRPTGGDVYRVAMPAYSAAMLTIPG
jgi:hypothetical protein